MRIEETALELTGLIYDAALAPEKWQAFMARLTQAMSARSALLREVDYGTGDIGIFKTVGYDPAYKAAYREHFFPLDYISPALARLPVGAAKPGDEVVPWEQQRNTEYYNDYLLPQNIRYATGGTLIRGERYHLQFGLQREARQNDFGDEDLRLLHILAPHMVRAAQIHHQMAEVNAQKHWALSALDRLRVGVIILNDRGRPVFLNRTAEHLAAGNNGFTAERNELALDSATNTARLRRLVSDAAQFAIGRSNAAGGCLRVNLTENSKGALQFQVIPLSQGLSERPWERLLPGGYVAVFVSTSGGPRLPCDRVAAMHGLTRAEAKLASKIADGISLEEAAEALGVSIQTVRSQLKSVFAKTGVSRQAELVALLLSDMLADS